ncbi:hypothetical protein AJ80_07920 [Polytolypa hystricis UAMH7299]|uniref:Mechanosensitive ion channel protein Msy1/2-like transmembrane domain-containing protein n=1 Tax=Polytolypa hystricis (strain UAMH7299) TaxID=1447883 RepID=A0A2B7XG63_POLH7|nr:hypothetical protein AJ80_07920 [Polytolypa hystricis UAMH7299]
MVSSNGSLQYEEAGLEKEAPSKRRRQIIRAIRYALIHENLVFYIFTWLEITWLAGGASDLIGLAFPHLFRSIATRVNHTQRRYWRVFRRIRLPITIAGTVVVCYVGFTFYLAVNWEKPENAFYWDDALDDILEQVAFWAAFYFFEKTLSKKMHRALVTLYEVSLYLNLVDSGDFVVEDSIICNPNNALRDPAALEAGKHLGKLGYLKTEPEPHWLGSSSTYAIVERALADPKPATALATRIWKSLFLVQYRTEEVQGYFNALAKKARKDILHDELVWTLIEVGKLRRNIYRSMADENHCLNTFDWILILFIALIMISFIAVLYIPSIKEIQQTVSFIAIGISFVIGRTINKFLLGCIFLFFEHTSHKAATTKKATLSSSIIPAYPDNECDYEPALDMNIVSVHELNKMEIKISFVHRDNWNNDGLCAKRSNRFMCYLVATVRKLQIQKTGGASIGDETNPFWQVVVGEGEAEKKKAVTQKINDEKNGLPVDSIDSAAFAEAKKKKAEETQTEEDAAFNTLTKVPVFPPKTLSSGSEVDTSGLEGSSGLRRRPGADAPPVFYP